MLFWETYSPAERKRSMIQVQCAFAGFSLSWVKMLQSP
jgi:hypothetical protein